MKIEQSKPSYKQVKYRENLLNAAEKIILEHGFNKATMEAMGNLAGVSRRTVYRIFSNRDVLLAELFESRSLRTSATLYDKVSGLDFDDAFLKGTIEGIKIAREDPLIMELMYGSGAAWYQRQMLDFDSPMYQMYIAINLKFWGPILDNAKKLDIINKKVENIEIIKWFTNVQYLMIIQTNMDVSNAENVIKTFLIPSLKSHTEN